MYGRLPSSLVDSEPPLAAPLGAFAAPPGASFGPGTAWDDDFLALGGRLRPIYGSQLILDERAPAYRVCCGDVVVSVTCTHCDGVVDSVVVVADGAPPSAELTIPFEHALGPNLQAAVTGAARRC